MKNKRIKCLIGAFLALGMTLSLGASLSLRKASNRPEIVLAEDAGEQETPAASTEEPKEEQPAAAQQESKPAQQTSSQSSSSSSLSASSLKQKGKKAIKIILQTLKDAVKDFINKVRRHIKF